MKRCPKCSSPSGRRTSCSTPGARAAALLRQRPRVSDEDLERTKLYAEERQRDQLQTQVGSMDDWLKSLEIKVARRAVDAAPTWRERRSSSTRPTR